MNRAKRPLPIRVSYVLPNGKRGHIDTIAYSTLEAIRMLGGRLHGAAMTARVNLSFPIYNY